MKRFQEIEEAITRPGGLVYQMSLTSRHKLDRLARCPNDFLRFLIDVQDVKEESVQKTKDMHAVCATNLGPTDNSDTIWD
jgi:hypothetical protein